MQFIDTRNGIKCKLNCKRIELVNKNFFNHLIELFNNLDRNLRDEIHYKKVVKTVNCTDWD